MNIKDLRKKILISLNDQGFAVNGHITPAYLNKLHYKEIHKHSRKEQISLQKNFLVKNLPIVEKYLLNGSDIDPRNISLELKLVEENSEENILFRWWNLMWWSIPFQRAYGRQMRFLVWDKTHNAPFGLIGLQSPILRMSVRDKYLNVRNEDLDTLINKSMQAQRLGALPPYNDLLGGKMVALTLASNELRKLYEVKYRGVVTQLNKRVLDSKLLFITTTSAYGKSSIYNRLKFNEDLVAKSIGYTKGSGTFHISQEIYKDIQKFLQRRNVDTSTTFGYGPSRKMKLIDQALTIMDLNEYHYHNIQREYFIFPLVKNLENVISKAKRPIHYNRPLQELEKSWKSRWCVPRSIRQNDWLKFKKDDFLKNIRNEF